MGLCLDLDDPLDRVDQRIGTARLEEDTRRDTGGQRRRIGLDHGIGEPSGARDHGYGAVTLRIELGETAGFEAGGYQDRVGAALHDMGKRLVVAELHPDPSLVLARETQQPGFQRRLPSSEDGEFCACADEPRHTRGDEVEPLLPGQAADDHEERRIVGIETEPRLDLAPVHLTLSHLLSRIRRGKMRIGCRIPDVDIDAIDDAVQGVGAARDEPGQPHPGGLARNLLCISRAHCGQCRGASQTGLQVADAAVILDTVDRISMRRQFETAEDVRAELALESEVVNRDDRWPVDTAIAHVGRNQRCLPVVDVNEVGVEPFQHAAREDGAGHRERREPLPVVGMVLAGSIVIRAARSCEKGGAIEHVEVELSDSDGDETCLLAEEVGEFMHRLTARGPRHDARITRDERADLNAHSLEHGRQGARDIGETTRLDQRVDLGSDRKNLHSLRDPARRSSSW